MQQRVLYDLDDAISISDMRPNQVSTFEYISRGKYSCPDCVSSCVQCVLRVCVAGVHFVETVQNKAHQKKHSRFQQLIKNWQFIRDA